jgi:hypothetical protein
VSRWCEVHHASSGPATTGGHTGFTAIVQLSKEEVIEACGRLAIAHRSLTRCGEPAAADELAAVFALLEQRVGLIGPSARPRV